MSTILREQLDAANRRIAELEAALWDVTQCKECNGAKQITFCRCVGQCTCDKPLFDCPQCNGEGRDYRGSELARAALAAAPESAPAKEDDRG